MKPDAGKVRKWPCGSGSLKEGDTGRASGAIATCSNRRLLNVVVNGVQAMPERRRGSICALERSRRGLAAARFATRAEGIPADVRDKIFQLYFTTKKGKGSGIGLAMTFQVVQLHGGTIDFSSEVDRGSEFRIALPPAAGARAYPGGAAPGAVAAESVREAT